LNDKIILESIVIICTAHIICLYLGLYLGLLLFRFLA